LFNLAIVSILSGFIATAYTTAKVFINIFTNYSEQSEQRMFVEVNIG
jgi:hypothetical protein